jgi:hypothetical protein
MKTQNILLIFAILWYSTLCATAQKNKLFPKNELYKDSDLTHLICKLQYALVKKDKNFILSIIDPDIENGFDGNKGVEEFKRIWKLESENSEIWLAMSKIISLGGVFINYGSQPAVKTSFVFPYVYDITLPTDTLDTYQIIAITGENVNLREKPDASSKVIGKLSYDIAICDYEKSTPSFDESQNKIPHNYCGHKEWYYITTLDNTKKGYANWDYVWSPGSYRMFFSKVKGQWKIVSFINGD